MSNLEPLDFLICINDFPDSLTTIEESMFGDNTNLCCHGKLSVDIEQSQHKS